MARSGRKRWRDLTGMARRANHVLAAAVVVFTAAILLGRLLEGWMVPLQSWLVGKLGASVAATVFGPLVVDLPKVIFLAAVAFPLGRVIAPRPWPTGIGLTGLVYAFDFGFHYVMGTHVLLYGHWRAILGRGLLLLLVSWAVIKLVQRGRQAAETADRLGAAPAKRSKKASKKRDRSGEDGSSEPAPEAEPEAESEQAPEAEPEAESEPACKQQPSENVREGER